MTPLLNAATIAEHIEAHTDTRVSVSEKTPRPLTVLLNAAEIAEHIEAHTGTAVPVPARGMRPRCRAAAAGV
jgi:hypothetical protein